MERKKEGKSTVHEKTMVRLESTTSLSLPLSL